MRKTRGLLFCFLLHAPLLISSEPTASVWRPPVPPDGCPTFRVEFTLLDVSKSMANGGLFDAARESLSQSIESAPSCELMILGTFGVTAEIRAAEFLTDAAARDRLKTALKPLRPRSGATNLDEAAKAIELLSYQLREAYGSRADVLVVLAYTDDVPSPSPGKEPFSLAGYLARRLDAFHVQVDDTGESLLRKPERVARLAVGSLTPAPADVARSRAARSNAVRGASPFLFLALGVALIAGVVLAARRFRLARQLPALGDTLVGVVITETEQAGPAAAVEVLGRNFRLAAASGLPVTFSSDPDRGAYIVAPGEGIPAEELFCIFPHDNGTVRVEGIAGVTAAGRPVTENGITVDAREGVVVSYGNRSFQIGLVFAPLGEPAAMLRRTA